jgi:hypothetical protein
MFVFFVFTKMYLRLLVSNMVISVDELVPSQYHEGCH